ncbi:hypothetical protein [Ornithinimicrobium sp. Y1694]|uniref:hypothetical protein n=1 Tax=Ornithinimicrobium sp. Y1694 TaxID=3418590 RepID=UPI003CF4F4D1
MNSLHAHLALRAAAERRAIAKTTLRHVHLHRSPLVIVGYHLAGDPGAPLAMLWGTDHTAEPHCMVVPEPRNRGLRFTELNSFAMELLDYLSQFDARDDDTCLDAPQIVVPNTQTAAWLGGIVGRFTRNLRTEGDAAAPPAVPLAGKHLSFLGDRLPGSSMLIALTDVLATHWQTGQLPSEDANLGTLLGWIDPPDGTDGPAAALAGERMPPAGPDSDPNWDADKLAELVQAWHAAENVDDDARMASVRGRLEDEVREQLTPAWASCWRGLRLMSSLQPAAHVGTRWAADLRDWTAHSDRIVNGRAYFRNIPTPTQAAMQLKMLEERTEQLQHEMAWDDPLVMATFVASGEALAGRVIAVDPDRRTQSGSGRQQRRPLITIAPRIDFARPTGTKLYLSTHPGVAIEVLPTGTDGSIPVEVTSGANTNPTIDRLPSVGDEVVFSPFGRAQFYPHSRVTEIPWTHQHILHDEQDD